MSPQPWKHLPGLDVRINGDFLQRNWEAIKHEFGVDKPPRLFGKEMIFRSFEKPDGSVEQHFVMLKENPAAKTLALTPDGHVIAVWQYKQGENRICLEIPGGAIEKPGESPEEARERELLEEVGYQAEKVVKLGQPQSMSSRNSMEARTHLYLSLGCVWKKRGRIEDSGEIMQLELVSLPRWIQLCHDEITDPFSLAATFLAMPLLTPLLPRG